MMLVAGRKVPPSFAGLNPRQRANRAYKLKAQMREHFISVRDVDVGKYVKPPVWLQFSEIDDRVLLRKVDVVDEVASHQMKATVHHTRFVQCVLDDRDMRSVLEYAHKDPWYGGHQGTHAAMKAVAQYYWVMPARKMLQACKAACRECIPQSTPKPTGARGTLQCFQLV